VSPKNQLMEASWTTAAGWSNAAALDMTECMVVDKSALAVASVEGKFLHVFFVSTASADSPLTGAFCFWPNPDAWATYEVNGVDPLPAAGIAARVYELGKGATLNCVDATGAAMTAWLPPDIYEFLRLNNPLPPFQCRPISIGGSVSTASGISSVARGADNAADVLWFNAKGVLAGAETHNDSGHADSDWSGFTLDKSTGRMDGGLQAIVSLSMGPGDERVFWVGPNKKMLYRIWAPVKLMN
jgi:hypothetical protein